MTGNAEVADSALREFMAVVIYHFRDDHIDRLVNFQATTWLKGWHQRAPKNLELLVPDIVDRTIMNFLHMLDRGLLTFEFRTASGEYVSTAQWRGQLLDAYARPGGLREQLSTQPINRHSVVPEFLKQ